LKESGILETPVSSRLNKSIDKEDNLYKVEIAPNE
jgi:hypothetical protein